MNTARLAYMLEAAWTTLHDRLAGLTDDEFFWQPVPGGWTVHEGADGRWTTDYAWPDPDPAPFTTLGWRLLHLAACKTMYHEYAFGPARLTWDDLPTPHSAANAVAWLEEGQALLRADLAALTDADLERLVQTNWGETWPAWRVFWTMAEHDLHHGGEIGLLRDLYRLIGRNETP